MGLLQNQVGEAIYSPLNVNWDSRNGTEMCSEGGWDMVFNILYGCHVQEKVSSQFKRSNGILGGVTHWN